jgi:leucyl aminopeptidase
METMKTDMAGAAAVFGAMQAIAELGLPIKVLGITPLTENMPGPAALRPGDVLTARNGKTIEVLNTDAEGRLVLADGLSLAVEHHPDLVVDLATLTGACKVALGEKIAGLLGTVDGAGQVQAAAEAAGERVWPLPLPSDYRKLIDSDVADMKNTGPRFGGAINAALLLKEFVGDVPWAHLDIAGPARASETEHYVLKGGTGFGVRTMVALAASLSEV